METITISKKAFDNLFQQTLEKLELINLREDTQRNSHDMHRKFHYEVCVLKNRIEKEE